MIPSSDTPMREASRDGSGGCVMCGRDLPSSRARYCTRACQQHCYRLRQLTPTIDLTRVRNVLQRHKALVAHTVYECGGCLRFVSSKSTSVGPSRDEELERRIPI